MKWFNDLKISKKLLSGFILTAAISAIIGVDGYLGTSIVSDNSLLLNENLVKVRDLSYANTSLLTGRADLLAIVSTNIQEQKQKYLTDLQDQTNKVNDLIDQFSRRDLSQEEKNSLSYFDQAWKIYVPLKDQAASLAMESKNDDALGIMFGSALEPLNQSKKKSS
jgi:methyl-accepting chemotaxis protein